MKLGIHHATSLILIFAAEFSWLQTMRLRFMVRKLNPMKLPPLVGTGLLDTTPNTHASLIDIHD
jgi:hypothetical protein